MSKKKYDLPEDEIVKLYESGQSTNKIAERYGCNAGTIYAVLKKMGVQIKKRQKFDGKSSDYDELILSLYSKECGSRKIAKTLGLSSFTVLDRLQKNGINTNENSKVDPNNLLKDKEQQILDLYASGHSATEIAEIIGHSQGQISKFFSDRNIEYKWKIGIDSDFFSSVDTPEKAYILGWWYSDGCVDNKSARIGIASDDDYVLEWIKVQTKYEGNIKRSPARSDRHKPLSNLVIHDKKFRDDLEKLGCVKNKSLILQFPDSSIVPDHLIWHFLRGEFDGDGSISIKNEKYGQCTITSSVDFCRDLSAFLTNNNIDNTVYYIKNSAMVYMNKTQSAIKFCDNIYRDANFFLSRKHDKYLTLKNLHSQK